MFQLAHGESAVLSTALLIAIREWQARLDNPALASLREETEAQIRIAQHMKDRVDGKESEPIVNEPRECEHSWVAGLMYVHDEDLDAVAKIRPITCERCDAVYDPYA